MPEPIEYQAIRNLQAALLAMSTAGGYHYDVAAGAVKLHPDHAADAQVDPDGPRPLLYLETDQDAWQYSPCSQTQIVMPLTVYWIGTSDATVDESWMQAFFRGCADVERAINVDPSLGGLVTETLIRKRLPKMDMGAQVWAVIDLELRFDRTYGQPDA